MSKTFTIMGVITHETVNNLHVFVNNNYPYLSSPQNVLYLNINSGGGDTLAAIAMYNYIKSLPCKTFTHNLYETSSAAIIVYLAGEQRSCEKHSYFLIHEMRYTINNSKNYQGLITEIKLFDRQIKDYTNIVNIETNCLNKQCDVESILRNGNGIIIPSSDAYKYNLTT